MRRIGNQFRWVGAIAGGLLGLSSLPHLAIAQPLPLPAALTALTSPTGQAWLDESTAAADFLPLVSHFVTQENQAFCGVASMAMVLNAMGIPAPLTTTWDQAYFTQETVLNDRTAAIIPRDRIEQQGLTLAELTAILSSHGVVATAHHGATVDLATMRSQWIANLQQPQNYIVINYLRRAIGQETGGHISPVAAYHAETDQFLVLDVSRYKYPPVWVPATDLWAAMNTLDSTSGQMRGYVLVEGPAPTPVP